MRHDSLLYFLDRMRPGLSELMCHVGTDNNDPPLGYHWLDELHVVTALTKKQLKEDYGIDVISYREAA